MGICVELVVMIHESDSAICMNKYLELIQEMICSRCILKRLPIVREAECVTMVTYENFPFLYVALKCYRIF